MEKVNVYEYCYKKDVNVEHMEIELMSCLNVLGLVTKDEKGYEFPAFIDLDVLDKTLEILEYKIKRGYVK